MPSLFVSGRIEVLGKHTDYCGGRSLVCAIDKGFFVEFAPNDDSFIRLTNKDTNEAVAFPLVENLIIGQDSWVNYPQTAAQRIAKNFKSRKLRGVDLEFRSNLPQAVGVSSSSALIIAVFFAISRINNLPEFEEYQRNIKDQFALGNYLGCIENGYDFGDLKGTKGVGTFGGSQDQTAIICGKENYLSQFSFCPVRFEADLYLPEDYVFVIASSGIVAEKTGAAKDKYNRLSMLSREIINKFETTLSLTEVIEKYGFDDVKAKLVSQASVNRLTQFYAESFEIIPQVSEYLRNNEFEKIGELIDLSHRNADQLLGNQTPETNFLQASARAHGALAASAFGAGFGGSVYALVEKGKSPEFLKSWGSEYAAKFPHLKASVFITRPSQSNLK